jgi:hypothetical protein
MVEKQKFNHFLETESEPLSVDEAVKWVAGAIRLAALGVIEASSGNTEHKVAFRERIARLDSNT